MAILKKIALYALGPIGVSGISFLVIPILAWKYSPNVVADYAVLQAIIAFGVLFFTLGSDQALFRDYYESKNKPQLLKNVLVISIVPMTCIILILSIFWNFFGSYIYTINSIWIASFTLLSVFFAVINRLLSLIQRLENQAFLFSVSQFLPKLLFLIAILVPVFTNDPNFYWVAGGQAFGLLVVNLYFFYINKKILIHSYFSSVDKILIKKLLDYGLPLLISNILFWLLRYADRFYVKYLSDNNELAMYALATSVSGGFAILGTLFNTIWVPKALRLYEKNDLDVEYLEKVAFLVSFIGLLIIILTFSLKSLIAQILPSMYSNIVYLLPLLILPTLYYTVAEIAGIGIALSKKTSKMVFVSTISALLHFGLSFLLIPKYGALGAAISIAVAFYFYLLLKAFFAAKVWSKSFSKLELGINLICLMYSLAIGFRWI